MLFYFYIHYTHIEYVIKIFLSVVSAAIAFQLLLAAETSTTSATPHPVPSGDRFSLVSPPACRGRCELQEVVRMAVWLKVHLPYTLQALHGAMARLPTVQSAINANDVRVSC